MNRGRVFGWSARRLAVLVSLVYVACTVLGFVAADLETRATWGWPVPGATVVLLSLLWPGGAVVGSRRGFLTALAGLWGIFVLLGVLFEVDWFRAAAWGAAELGAITAVLWCYRRWVSPQHWFPDRPRRLVGLALITLLAGVVVAVGAMLGAGPVEPWPWSAGLLVWYAAGWTTRVCIGAVIGLAWAHPMREHVRLDQPAVAMLGLPASLFALVVAGLNPGMPLMWLALLPALTIGLTLTPRWAAFAASGLGVLVWLAPYAFPGWTGADDPMRPATLHVTALAALLFAMGLALMRDRNAVLDQELDRFTRRAAAQSAVLDAVISAMADGVLITDHAGGTLLVNPAARALLGPPLDVADAPGWTGRYRLFGEGGRPLRGGEIAVLEAPGPVRLQGSVRVALTAPGDGGELRALVATCRELRTGTAGSSLVLLTDETSALERRRELEAFAGVVAHDLRNPLSAVALWLDAARFDLGRDPGPVREALTAARSASRRMRQVIEDYLGYAVGREGVLRIEDVDLAEVVGSVAAMYAGLEAGPTIVPPAPAWVRADEALLRQVFANIIGNSVKYARPGDPAYVVVSAAAGHPPGWVAIEVADRGIGMDEGDAEEMFAPFGRTARGAAVQEGTGLGLALCRSIVARHGGTIGARGNDWGGTTIELLLPQADRPGARRGDVRGVRGVRGVRT